MSKPQRTPGLAIRIVDDEVLVHDGAHERVHVLNASAGRVLDMCDGLHCADDIARALSAGTGAGFAVVRRDVDAVLREFACLQLVDAGNDSSETQGR